MKVPNLVRILMLLAILGMVTLHVAYLNAESTEKKTEFAQATENNSKSANAPKDVEVNVETDEKLQEVLDKVNEAVKGIEELNIDGIIDERKLDVDALLEQLKEHSKSLKDIQRVKVEILEPTEIISFSNESEDLDEFKKKIKKLIEDGNLNSEMAIQLKELVDNMKIFKAAAQDGEIVSVLQYGPNVTAKISKDLKGNKDLLDKIKELASDEDLESDELVKKVQDLVNDMKSGKSVLLDKDNVKVYQYGPHVTTKTFTDIKDYKELGEKISKLAKDENLESDELAKKVLELVKDTSLHFRSGIVRGGVKIVPLDPSQSEKEDNDSSIEKLEKRITKLETKIDQLIEKLSNLEPESSENE